MSQPLPEKLSAEEQLKGAARRVFLRKGYAATRTRDIAEEAGQNLALLNYYFRSKQNLFDLVLRENTQQFFGVVAPLFHDAATTLDEKIVGITSQYIDLLLQQPEMPMFVLSELRANPTWFSQQAPLMQQLAHSAFARQLVERQPTAEPVQVFLTFIGMLLFPFILKPVVQAAEPLGEAAFAQLMHERKALVVRWMGLIIE